MAKTITTAQAKKEIRSCIAELNKVYDKIFKLGQKLEDASETNEKFHGMDNLIYGVAATIKEQVTDMEDYL